MTVLVTVITLGPLEGTAVGAAVMVAAPLVTAPVLVAMGTTVSETKVSQGVSAASGPAGESPEGAGTASETMGGTLPFDAPLGPDR